MPTNPGKLSLAKEMAIFISAFFPKLPNQEPKDPPDWIILDIWALLKWINRDNKSASWNDKVDLKV